MVTKLTLAYDGTDFAGWARQPGLRSVQQEVEQALQTVLGEPLALTVAGRTDRGVHAWGQVASYGHEAVDPKRLNGLLPDDVAVLAAEPAPDGFDARRDAISRTYCYRVLTTRVRGVFERERSLWWPHELDREVLQACAQALVGIHDFTAFTPTDTDHVRFEREVMRAAWKESRGEGKELRGEGKEPGGEGSSVEGASPGWPRTGEETLEFWIEGDTFMRHMNRILVGTMLEVAGGRRTFADFERLLEGRPRSEAGPTASAHGLALASVAYT